MPLKFKDEFQTLDQELANLESLESEQGLLEAKCRARGLKFAPFKYSEDATAADMGDGRKGMDFILMAEELERHNATLRGFLALPPEAQNRGGTSSSLPVAGGPSHDPTRTNPVASNLNATQRCIEANKGKLQARAADTAAKQQRAKEYFAKKASATAEKPLTATENALKAKAAQKVKTNQPKPQ